LQLVNFRLKGALMQPVLEKTGCRSIGRGRLYRRDNEREEGFSALVE